MSPAPPKSAAALAGRVLVLSFSNLQADPRVGRQLRLLATRYRVAVTGTAEPGGTLGVTYIRVPRTAQTVAGKIKGAFLLKLNRYEDWYWSSSQVRAAFSALREEEFDVVLANDISTLPLALRLSKGAPVLLDAHEYAPREFEENFKWRFFLQRYNEYLCSTYLRHVSAMFTVSASIAAEYRLRFGVKPRVLRNTPTYHNIVPSRGKEGVVRLVHHGAAIRSRRLEIMLDTIKLLDEQFHLDLYLVPAQSRYIRYLRQRVSGFTRIRFLPPIPTSDIVQQLNAYDVGVYLLPPTSLNNRFSLPNKFFEFIQARLAVAIGPSPEMAHIVREYECGVVADDFSAHSLARCLRELTPARIQELKWRSHAAASELCFEREGKVLLDTVEELMRR